MHMKHSFHTAVCLLLLSALLLAGCSGKSAETAHGTSETNTIDQLIAAEEAAKDAATADTAPPEPDIASSGITLMPPTNYEETPPDSSFACGRRKFPAKSNAFRCVCLSVSCSFMS